MSSLPYFSSYLNQFCFVGCYSSFSARIMDISRSRSPGARWHFSAQLELLLQLHNYLSELGPQQPQATTPPQCLSCKLNTLQLAAHPRKNWEISTKYLQSTPNPEHQYSDDNCRDDLHRDGADQEQVRDQWRRLRVCHHAAGADQAPGRDQGQERGGGEGEPRHDPGGARHHRHARHRHPPRLLLVPQVEAKIWGVEVYKPTWKWCLTSHQLFIFTIVRLKSDAVTNYCTVSFSPSDDYKSIVASTTARAVDYLHEVVVAASECQTSLSCLARSMNWSKTKN